MSFVAVGRFVWEKTSFEEDVDMDATKTKTNASSILIRCRNRQRESLMDVILLPAMATRYKDRVLDIGPF